MLPALPLTGAQAQRDDRREALRLEPRQDGVVVEPSVEEDRPHLAPDHLEVVEGGPNGGEGAAVPRMEPEGGDETEAVAEDREGGKAVGPVSAPLLLGLDHLASVRVLGLAVVGSVREVDGDIDGFLRNVGPDLTTEGERERPLGVSEAEMTEQPPSGSVGVATSALGPSAMDRTSEGGGAEEEVGRIVEGGGPKGPAEGALQEGEEPRQGGGTYLTIGEGPRPPSGPAERRVFLSEASSLRCGLATAAAGCWAHTKWSAVFLSSTSISIGKGDGQKPPRSRQFTSGGRLPSTGIPKQKLLAVQCRKVQKQTAADKPKATRLTSWFHTKTIRVSPL